MGSGRYAQGCCEIVLGVGGNGVGIRGFSRTSSAVTNGERMHKLPIHKLEADTHTRVVGCTQCDPAPPDSRQLQEAFALSRTSTGVVVDSESRRADTGLCLFVETKWEKV